MLTSRWLITSVLEQFYIFWYFYIGLMSTSCQPNYARYNISAPIKLAEDRFQSLLFFVKAQLEGLF